MFQIVSVLSASKKLKKITEMRCTARFAIFKKKKNWVTIFSLFIYGFVNFSHTIIFVFISVLSATNICLTQTTI